MTWVEPSFGTDWAAEDKVRHASKEKNTEPQPEKCKQCGQLVRKAYLSGSGVDIVALGQEMSFEPDAVVGGDFFFAGHIAYPLREDERPDVSNLPFFKEHRCPGFKS